ncbi:hypothetical protein AOLI_G00078460 [Acnodon oligacanthus]
MGLNSTFSVPDSTFLSVFKTLFTVGWIEAELAKIGGLLLFIFRLRSSRTNYYIVIISNKGVTLYTAESL